MNALGSVSIILLLGSSAVIAAPASDSAIKQLLVVTQAQKLMDGTRAQFDTLMVNVVQQELKGKTPTPQQQQAIEKMRKKIVEVMQAELAWEKIEPLYLRLYKESFTEEEIGGMLAFYKTPAGQAVITKMPVLMQKTMFELQKMVSGMVPRMQTIQEEFAPTLETQANRWLTRLDMASPPEDPWRSTHPARSP